MRLHFGALNLESRGPKGNLARRRKFLEGCQAFWRAKFFCRGLSGVLARLFRILDLGSGNLARQKFLQRSERQFGTSAANPACYGRVEDVHRGPAGSFEKPEAYTSPCRRISRRASLLDEKDLSFLQEDGSIPGHPLMRSHKCHAGLLMDALPLVYAVERLWNPSLTAMEPTPELTHKRLGWFGKGGGLCDTLPLLT